MICIMMMDDPSTPFFRAPGRRARCSCAWPGRWAAADPPCRARPCNSAADPPAPLYCLGRDGRLNIYMLYDIDNVYMCIYIYIYK